MNSIKRNRLLWLAVCAGLGVMSPRASAVIVWSGQNPLNNGNPEYPGNNLDITTNPDPGNVANYEGGAAGGFTGTTISPTIMLSASHVAPGPTQTFTFDNGTYYSPIPVTTTYNMQEVVELDDMALWQIIPNEGQGIFSTYAPVYTGGNEVGSSIIDVGRGYARGNPATGGWSWGDSNNGALTWGTNTISQTDQGYAGTNFGGDFLQYDFNPSPSNPNEAIDTEGDSGGGLFVDVNGVYELAGVNSLVDTVFDSGGNRLSLALYDQYGYYQETGPNQFEVISTHTPMSTYATRLSSKANLIGLVDGSISPAQAALYPINDNGQLTLFSSLVTGAIIGGAAVQVGTAAVTATLQLAPNSGASEITALSLVRNSTLDITNNSVLINFSSGSDPIVAIAGYIKSGFNNGHWNGSGIISTTAQTPTNGHNYGVGYADGADGVVAGLSSGQIELRYTLLGDANLDGIVNAIDFGILSANYGKLVTSWDQGDFNYDGVVNGIDFGELSANYGQGVGGGATAADIAALEAFAAANSLPVNLPEPATGALTLAATLAIVLRRRRKSTTP